MRLALSAILLAALLAATGTVTSGFTTVTSAPARFAAAPLFAPRLVEPPAISGVATDGETLTATRGEWARDPATLEVEWLRCGEECEAVASGDQLELSPADVGKRMRVRVTAANGGGSAVATSAATDVVLPLPPPVNEAPAAIGGTPTVGQTLTADDGAWSGRRLALTRRWLRCTTSCSPIAGERDATYLVTGDDAGATIRLEVDATNASGSASTTSPPTAAVTRAVYTQLLCADPATGRGVAADGVLPGGVRVSGSLAKRYDPALHVRCSTAAAVPSLPLTIATPFATTRGDDRVVLEYAPGPAVAFRGATLYRHGRAGGGWSWSVQSSDQTGLLDGPLADLCRWRVGCTTSGSATDRFAEQNRVTVAPGTGPGFNVTFACDIPAGGRCDHLGEAVWLHGGTITLQDTSTPTVAGATGGLVADGPLDPLDDLDLTVTDTGSGLRRLIVTIDAREVASRLLHDNGGRCVDHDAATSGFESAFPQPCVPSIASSMLFDTTAWPEDGRLRVYVEDAGQNTAVVVNRPLG